MGSHTLMVEVPHALGTISLSALRNGGILLAIYLVTLVVYRLYFHPLAQHPGPFWAKITDWYSVYHAYKGDRHLVITRAHEKYGPVIRFAPNGLSFNSATALKAIYGHSAVARAVQKGKFYLAFPAVPGVHNTHNAISKLEHGRKRRVLSAAFSDAALKSMEPLVLQNVDELIRIVEEQGLKGSGGIDMGEAFSWFTFDVMGELCFGRSFAMLSEPAQRFVTGLIDKAAHMHYIAGNYLPIKTLGIGRILFPTIVADRWKFIEHSRACANDRMKAGHSAKKDFFYYLLHAKDPETGEGFSTKELWGESNVLMIAGSDTTATALSSTLFHVTKNPAVYEKLQKEVRERFNSVDEIVTGPELGGLPYLKACIDEAMRLAPPVPGILPREVIAKEGCTVDGVHVPFGTVIGCPIYALHHNDKYYPDPYTYNPERWLGDEKAVEAARSAFTPFSIGARGCIGKSVAYMELRLAIARLMFLYDIEQKKVEGKADMWKEGFATKEGEYRLKDHFTSRKEGPVCEFSPRKLMA